VVTLVIQTVVVLELKDKVGMEVVRSMQPQVVEVEQEVMAVQVMEEAV
jgi:hypothetical protein